MDRGTWLARIHAVAELARIEQRHLPAYRTESLCYIPEANTTL